MPDFRRPRLAEVVELALIPSSIYTAVSATFPRANGAAAMPDSESVLTPIGALGWRDRAKKFHELGEVERMRRCENIANEEARASRLDFSLFSKGKDAPYEH